MAPPFEVMEVMRAAGRKFTKTVNEPKAIISGEATQTTGSVIRDCIRPIVSTLGEPIAMGAGVPGGIQSGHKCKSVMRAAGSPMELG